MANQEGSLLEKCCTMVIGDNCVQEIQVNKPLDCEFDLGELLVIDPNAVENYKLK